MSHQYLHDICNDDIIVTSLKNENAVFARKPCPGKRTDSSLDITLTNSNTGWLVKKRHKFSALEKIHVASLGRIALAIGQSRPTVCALLIFVTPCNEVTQDVIEKYWMKYVGTLVKSICNY